MGERQIHPCRKGEPWFHFIGTHPVSEGRLLQGRPRSRTFEGKINDCIDGENGFGYDPIFYYPPLKKTSAVMTMEEKNKVSHRAKALKALYDYLEEEHK